MRYAGFWMRVGAFFVDFILLTFVSLAVLFLCIALGVYIEDRAAMRSIYKWIFFLNSTVYNAVLEASPMQGSIGKWILGLKVTDMDGTPVSFLQALGRNLGKLLSSLVFFLGYLGAAFTEQKQTLHDIFSSCLVIRR